MHGPRRRQQRAEINAMSSEHNSKNSRVAEQSSEPRTESRVEQNRTTRLAEGSKRPAETFHPTPPHPATGVQAIWSQRGPGRQCRQATGSMKLLAAPAAKRDDHGQLLRTQVRTAKHYSGNFGIRFLQNEAFARISFETTELIHYGPQIGPISK